MTSGVIFGVVATISVWISSCVKYVYDTWSLFSECCSPRSFFVIRCVRSSHVVAYVCVRSSVLMYMRVCVCARSRRVLHNSACLTRYQLLTGLEIRTMHLHRSAINSLLNLRIYDHNAYSSFRMLCRGYMWNKIISVFYFTCKYSETEIKLLQPLKKFRNYFSDNEHVGKYSWAAIRLWNNSEIISTRWNKIISDGRRREIEMKLFWNNFISHVNTALPGMHACVCILLQNCANPIGNYYPHTRLFFLSELELSRLLRHGSNSTSARASGTDIYPNRILCIRRNPRKN